MEEKKDDVLEKQKKAYHWVYVYLGGLSKLLYPMKVIGLENLPDGPAMLCANHSNFVDPILVCKGVGEDKFPRVMAKIELSGIPVVSAVMRKIGVIFVNRGETDLNAIRSSMKYLKQGCNVLLFPEGTRAQGDGDVDAKTGAVRIAGKTGVPIVPIYLPRHKKVFSKTYMVIGEPYKVSGRSHEEHTRQADELMERIYALKDKAAV